jgi:serine protease Do
MVAVVDTDSGQAAVKRADSSNSSGSNANSLGVVVSEPSDSKKRELNIRGGVEVTGLGDGPLARAGVRTGDVIIRIADADITGVKQFESLVKGLDANKSVPVFVRRSDSTLIIPVRPK